MSTLGKHWKVRDTSKMKGFQKKHTETTKEKMSESKKKNPTRYWLGKSRHQETKDKIKKSLTGRIGTRLGKHCSEESCKRMSIAQSGEKSHCWIDGKSFEPYTIDWTETLKRSIRERDNYVCQLCGRTQIEELEEIEKKLSCHHIDYNKKNCDPENLITLCKSCHAKTNFNRKYWTRYFKTYKNGIK